jgi:hypothetical protein
VNRPADWSPLRGSDPTPGDPDVVGDQARHYSDVAAELRSQVSRLRRIGQDSELQGRYADKLREAADDLVGDLQKVERRYSRAAAALRRWEPQLREGQQRADRILVRARSLDDERRALHRQAGTVGRRELPDDPTPVQQIGFDADQAAAERIRRRLEDIDHELRGLERELGTVEDRVEGDGRAVGAEIRSASDNGIEDTTWEDIKGTVVGTWRAVDAFLDDHADLISAVAEALQYVAMALAVVALFIPGLNLLVIGLTVGLALTQGLLYASGNATFTDLASAGLSLLTLGLGAVAGKVIARALARTRTTAAAQAGAVAAAGARAETRPAREALGRRLGQRLRPAQRAQARNELDEVQARTAAEAERRAAQAEREYLDEALAQARPKEILLDAGVENARHMNDIARIQRQFPSAEVQAAGREAERALHVARVSQGVGTVADVGSGVLGESRVVPGKPYSQGFEDVKAGWDPLR